MVVSAFSIACDNFSTSDSGSLQPSHFESGWRAGGWLLLQLATPFAIWSIFRQFKNIFCLILS